MVTIHFLDSCSGKVIFHPGAGPDLCAGGHDEQQQHQAATVVSVFKYDLRRIFLFYHFFPKFNFSPLSYQNEKRNVFCVQAANHTADSAARLFVAPISIEQSKFQSREV